MNFDLKSAFQSAGDQPQAIEKLVAGLAGNSPEMVLLGVTGSGKTFTVANVIEKLQLPTLVISHNKTLAAQLTQEFKEFFPRNAVEYFVSYYDYYQPEAYIPQTDTYIEKEATINEEIDRLRLSATTSLSTRNDVIVCASVSCIYNIGSPEAWQNKYLKVSKGDALTVEDAIEQLIPLFYERSDFDFKRGTFRVRGDNLQIYSSYENSVISISFHSHQSIGESEIMSVKVLDPLTLTLKEERDSYVFYPSKHHLVQEKCFKEAIAEIKEDLGIRLTELKNAGKKLEAYRLKQKTNYDLEMIQEVGYCNGIENYSRYFEGREPGSPPYTLIDYFQGKDKSNKWLLVVDESHITLPQIRGMYHGDLSRKKTLIDYGFRLPSALDNRPLRFEEFLRRLPQTIYMSATPGDWELGRVEEQLPTENSAVVEQLVRPTGLVDPEVTVRPIKGQIANLICEIKKRVEKKERVLVTTITKRLAEALSERLEKEGIKATYLHSDIATLERTDILDELRSGKHDVLVGINLLREGLDLPEVSLVAILDADKEGFLRSETSLIQVMGRAARHINGAVIMYADSVTGSMARAIEEVQRRRQIQLDYNQKHHIVPKSIIKERRSRLIEKKVVTTLTPQTSLSTLKKMPPSDQKNLLKQYEALMKSAAELWDFESAAFYRDEIKKIRRLLATPGV